MTKDCTAGRRMQSASTPLFSRTALPIIAVGAVLLAAGIYGAWRVHRIHKRGSDILSGNVASIRAAQRLDSIAQGIQYRLKRYLNSTEERHLESIEEALPVGAATVDKLSELSRSGPEQALVEEIRQGYSRLQTGMKDLRRESSTDGRFEFARDLANAVIPDSLLAPGERYTALNEGELDRSRERNQSAANRLMFGLLLLGTCGGVAGLIAGYAIARFVNRTIVRLTFPIRDAAGKLSQVGGPVTIAAEPGFDDLESMLQAVSGHVANVVERLQESERDRLRAEQLAVVGQLAAGLAHELRNPLTSVKAILQLADNPSDLTARDLSVLREETNRLERSVQSLLDFARPSAPLKSPLELNLLLQQTVHLIERRAEREGIRLDCDPHEAPLDLMADEAQIRQVVLNVLLNAIDVTPGGGLVRVRCCAETETNGPHATSSRRSGSRAGTDAPAGGWGVFRVIDSGPGLPDALGQRIFDPFVTTKETGTGLGLSICKRIVEAHGGQITASNQASGGAAFEVRLPLLAVDAERSLPGTPVRAGGEVEGRLAAKSPSQSVAAGDR